MKKNFSKALAGTLTVAMVLGMAAPAAGTTAQAASTNGIKTKYKAIYAGKSKTYTLKTAKKTTKWTVTGEGKEYVTLSAKKGKSVTVTVAKDAPAGVKATVVAKLANKKGKYKKVDADKFTIKVDATAVNVSGSAEVKTGDTATYTATTTPAKTTNHVYFTVTDKDGNATTGATISTTSGVLTANKAGSYKVNVATARGDKKAAAGTFTANASMDVNVTDKVAPEAKLTSAKQTEAKKIVVTFDSEVKEIKNEDITVVNDSDKSSKTLKSVTIGEDKKTATIEVLVDILDGKSYTVTYKGSTAQFTASDGTVADFSLNTNEFQIKKKQELKVNVLDKNQVIIKTIDVKDASTTDGKYTINVTSNDGYFTDDKLVMQTVGKTEEVTATYHSQKYNSTTGAEEGNVEKKFTITAVAQADLASKYEYATVTDEGGVAEWSEETCSLQLPVNESNKKYLFAKINDVKGVTTIDGKVYDADLNITCTSSDETILLVNASDDNVELSGVKAGTAYVQVKQNGVTKLTIPVTVTAARTLTNAVLDGASATISNSSALGTSEDKTVKLDTHKDQYNEELTHYEIDSVSATSYPSGQQAYAEAQYKTLENDKKEFVFKAANAPKGTYKYEITFKDTDTDKTLKRTQTITVKAPDFSKTPTLKIKMDSDKDVAVKKKGDAKSDSVKIQLGLYYDGILGAYYENASGLVATDDITLTKNGSKETGKITTSAITSDADTELVFVTGDALNFKTKAMKSGDGHTYCDKLGTGSYQFKINTENSKDSIAAYAEKFATGAALKNFKVTDNGKTLTKTITIKDTQPTLTVNQVKNNVDASSAEDAIKKAVTFKYDGKTYKKADEDAKYGIEIGCTQQSGTGVATKDVQYYKNGSVYNIVKMNVYVALPDGDNNDKISSTYDNAGVKFEKKPSFSITVND